MIRNLLIALVLFVCPAFAQNIGIGMKGGFRVTTDFARDGRLSPESPRYVFGPMVEVMLPRGFILEVDALYSRFGFTSSRSSGFGASTTTARGTSWEIPLLIKHRIPLPFAHLYAEAGYAPRRTGGSHDSTSTLLDPVTGSGSRDFSSSYPIQPVVSHGLVVGGGVELAVGSLRIAPGVRYTRSNRAFYNELGYGSYISASANQVQVLVGFSWPLRPR